MSIVNDDIVVDDDINIDNSKIYNIPNNFNVIIDNKLIRGSRPTKNQLDYLKTLNVNTIIDLDPKIFYNTEEKYAKKLGINYISKPLSIFCGTESEKIYSIHDLIDELIKNNKKIYIHCKDGIDRTSLIIATYVSIHPEISFNDSYDLIWENHASIYGAPKSKICLTNVRSDYEGFNWIHYQFKFPWRN